MLQLWCTSEATSGAGGGLRLLRVAGGCGSGLPGQRVHGAQELVGDASGLAEAAEQGTVDRGGIVPDGVLTGEEEARNRLAGVWKKESTTWGRITKATGKRWKENTARIYKYDLFTSKLQKSSMLCFG